MKTRMKTCTSSLIFLMAGLHFITHHPGLFRSSTDFIMKVRCHSPGPRSRLGGRQRTPGTVTQSRTCSSAPALASLRVWAKGTRLLSTWTSQGSTFPLVDSQADTNTTAPMTVCSLLLPWRCMCGAYQFTWSPQSQQCRSWSGWKPFCSVGAETSGAAQSFLGGCTGGVFSVALLWLFTLPMIGKGGRGSYSSIYPAF